jgi:hypothetical protein
VSENLIWNESGDHGGDPILVPDRCIVHFHNQQRGPTLGVFVKSKMKKEWRLLRWNVKECVSGI